MNHVIEEETGTCANRPRHRHNGYYAGDFSTVPFHRPELSVLLTLTSAPFAPPRRTTA